MSASFRHSLDENAYVWENRLKGLTHRYGPVFVFLLAVWGVCCLFLGNVEKALRPGPGPLPGGKGRPGNLTGSWLQQVQNDPSGEMVYEDPASESGDGFLHFAINKGEQSTANVQALLRRYCSRVNLVSKRFHDNGVAEVVYRLVLSDPSYSDDLVEQLESLSGISQITFMLHEEQAEV
jgi:hypothetical protein